MKNILYKLLLQLIKRQKHRFKGTSSIEPRNKLSDRGFTLTELLVATIMSVIIITPLLSFAVNILKTENVEQAKSTTDQELQSALDFIARDLEQAVYIYDDCSSDGCNIHDNLTTNGGGTPILVFWKLENVSDVVPIADPGSKTRSEVSCTDNSDLCDDARVYSLVAYFYDDGSDSNDDGSDSNNSVWSDAAQIRRMQIQGAIEDPYGNLESFQAADDGFQLFDLTGAGTREDNMESWTNTFDNDGSFSTTVLVDYIYEGSQASNFLGNGDSPNCDSFLGSSSQSDRQIGDPTSGFFACVDSEKTLATVFIRGDVDARLNSGKTDLLPTARVSVKGRGLLGQ